MFSRVPGLTGFLASAGLLLTAVTPAQAVTIWNWSFTTSNAQQFGSGTFTTTDVIPAINTAYTITGISGTYNRGGTAYTITGLDTGNPNIFYYDGTNTSPVIVDGVFTTSGGGISFRADGKSVNLFRASTTRGPLASTSSGFSGADASITSSLLQPVSSPAPASVPGPLPLFGAAAGFAASRRLRKRTKLHSQPPVA